VQQTLAFGRLGNVHLFHGRRKQAPELGQPSEERSPEQLAFRLTQTPF
jgi:hypothetical protein